MHAIRTCLSKPFGLSGRATRAEYGWSAMGLAPTARRRHDVNRSGWVMLMVPPAFLFFGWTFILAVTSAFSTMPTGTSVKFAEIAFPFAGLLFLTSVLVVLFPLLRASTPAENRHSPPPLQEINR